MNLKTKIIMYYMQKTNFKIIKLGKLYQTKIGSVFRNDYKTLC